MTETSDVVRSFDQSTDAAEWAKAFCERFVISTAEGVVQDAEGLMLGWFANAIMRGYDEGYAKADEAKKMADKLAEALRLTQEYCGDDLLPPKPGWSWFDALEAYKSWVED